MDRDDCPWYPTMTLFRQAERGDWKSVFERIASGVEACIAKQDTRLTDKPRQTDPLSIPGAAGELIDKITILEIKEDRISKLKISASNSRCCGNSRPNAATGVND